MPPEESKTVEKNEMISRRETGLNLLAVGDSSGLTEIVSRSLVHIQTTKLLGGIQRSCSNEITAGRLAGEELEFKIGPRLKIVMCWIPPGEFLMGSPEDEDDRLSDETQHQVIITKGFWLAKTQTTQAQWQAVMGNNPSVVKGENFPVSDIGWDEITGSVSGTPSLLGELRKLTAPTGHFHLPTEAQWEYACRAGTTGPYSGDLDSMGWYSGNSMFQRYPVGQKEPNGWGLQDMHGNVFEWCSDWYGAYDLGEVLDPTGPAMGTLRVVRGGSWNDDAGSVRCAARFHDCPNGESYGFTGFRLAFNHAQTANRGIE